MSAVFYLFSKLEQIYNKKKDYTGHYQGCRTVKQSTNQQSIWFWSSNLKWNLKFYLYFEFSYHFLQILKNCEKKHHLIWINSTLATFHIIKISYKNCDLNFVYLRNNTLLHLQMILTHMINYAPFIQCVHCVNNLNSLLKTNLNLCFHTSWLTGDEWRVSKHDQPCATNNVC